MGKSGDPEGETTATLPRPRDPKMQAAKVHMLNGTSKDFELNRGSEGEVLFTLVTTELSIEEREYFSLCFYDENGLRHWLYNDKKILKQLKGLPWEFSFEVKFYPTSPASLNDDNARYNLFLQLRKDVASGRLPATIPTHATLGAYVAQAEYGDADSSAEYERYLKDSQEIPNLKDQGQLLQLLEKVKEVHREQKGLTAAEAESKYLDTCKQLSMYGVFVFDAKDDDNNRIGVGICATGINIYKETIRVHRFAWQNIVKISYKKNVFSVKLKAGELDKKEVTLSYKVQDYLYAKRVWKCGVEHHTFFRLIQPEDKPKTGIFNWGSTRFRYQGRTQFQTKMASQMFDHTQSGTVRSTGNRLSQSCDNGLNKENVARYETSATLGRDGQRSSPIASPGVSYEISSSKRAGSSHGKVGTSIGADDELVYTPVESPTSAAYYLSERSSLRSPYSSGAVSPNDWSAWGRDVVFRHSSARRNLFGRMTDNSGTTLHIVAFDDDQPKLSSTERALEIEHIPIQQSVTLYHRGFYTQPPTEPTVRIQHYAPRNGYHPIGRLQPRRELDAHPLRFFVNINHSGQPQRPRIKRERHPGVEDIVQPLPHNYVFATPDNHGLHTLPFTEDIPAANILQYSTLYYYGNGSTEDIHKTEKPNDKLVARVLPLDVPSSQGAAGYSQTRIKETTTSKEESRKRSLSSKEPIPSPVKETSIEHEIPKKKAILHVKSASKQAQISEEKPEVRLVAKILPSEADRTFGVEKDVDTSKSRQTSSSLLGFLKTSGHKSKSTSSETSSNIYPSTSDRYEGPLDSTNRNDDLTNLPLEHHPRVPYVTKIQKTTAVTKEIPEEFEVERKHFRYIARIRHEGEEDVVEKDQVKPELYGLPSTSYEGPLEDIGRQDDLELQPLGEHVNVYHSGQSWTKTIPSPVKETSIEHEIPKKKAILHVKSASKQAQISEEKPEVRLVAKILPSEADRTFGVEKDVDTSKSRQTSSSLLGFLKTSGHKSKSTSSETSSNIYPSTSDRYEGPLDSTNRNDDLTNLPLEHHPRVPYVTKIQKTTAVTKEIPEEFEVERKHFRYIARIRHEGEEDVVEKDQVKPELYGLPSTSYEGPLEDIGRQDDLELQPLGEHVNVYHSGQSWTKTIPSPVKETSIEHEIPKKKAILHVKSASKQAQISEEKPEVRLVAKILPSEADRTTGVEKDVDTSKSRQTSSSLLGFLKTSGHKSKSTSSETSSNIYPSTSDRYEGPLDSTNRNDDLTNLPLEHHPRVPYVTKIQKTTAVTKEIPEEFEVERKHFRYIARIRHEGEEDVVEKDQVKPELYGLPSTSYEGPLEDIGRQDDLELQPLGEHVNVYHSGQSWTKTIPSPVKETSIEHEIPKKKAILHVKSASKQAQISEEKPEVRLVAKILPSEADRTTGVEKDVDTSKSRQTSSSLLGFLKTSGHKSKSTSSETSSNIYPSTSDRYEGPLDSTNRNDDLTNLPLEHHPRVPYVTKIQKTTAVTKEIPEEFEVERKHFRYIARIRHEGEEDVVEKDQVKPELYGLPSTSYEGPLEDIGRQDDLELQPLGEHVNVYHSGQSWTKTIPSPVKETSIEHEIPKKKAILHVKSASKQAQISEEKPEVRLVAKILPSEADRTTGVEKDVDTSKSRQTSSSLLGFLKTSGHKSKSTSSETSSNIYPSTSDRYEGPLDSTNRNDDLTNLPLEHHPRVPYVTKIQKTTAVTKEIPEEFEVERKHFRYIARIRHEGEEDVVEKDQVKPELYGLPSTSYEGPLEDIGRQDDLELQPLGEHVNVYHSGQSWTKTIPSPVKETSIEHEIPKKKAILHVKSASKQAQISEEKPEVRLVAKILPSEADRTTGVEKDVDTSKSRQTSSSLLGFLKTSGHKSKSTSSETSSNIYPSTSDRYEGPLDSTNRNDDLTNLPLEHHPRVPYVTKIQKTTAVTKEIPEEFEVERKHFRYIARIRHEGEEDVVEKDQVKPELYGLPSTSYEGPLEDIGRQDDLELQPLGEHVNVYHSGQSWTKTIPSPVKETSIEHEIPKKKAILHVKSASKQAQISEEKPEVRLVAKILPSEADRTTGVEKDVDTSKSRQTSSSLLGFLKTSGHKSKSTSSETSSNIYPSTSDRYEGPLDSTNRNDDLTNLPLEHHPRVPYVTKIQKTTAVTKEIPEEFEVERKHFRYIARIRHEGEEDVVEKDQVKPELYGLPSTSYEGPLEDIGRQDDLELQPLGEHVNVYHSGQSWTKTIPSPVKETSIEHEIPKKKAILHVKSASKQAQISEEKPEVRLVAKILPSEADRTTGVEKDVDTSKSRQTSSSLLGFLKTSGHRSVSSSRECRPDFSSALAYRCEGMTAGGDSWVEVRLDRRVEVQLEPMFCLSGAGIGAVSEDEGGLVYAATSSSMAPVGRSLLSRLGFKNKKSKKSKGEHEKNSSESSSSEDDHVKIGSVVESLSSTIAEAERLNQHSPRLEHAERTITVRALAPLPVSFEESGQPHTTVASWQESTVLPDQVTVQYDDQGNRITRTIKTSQVKHTVQKQSFQNYTVPEEADSSSTVERTREQLTPIGSASQTGPIVDTQTRSVIYESNTPVQGESENLGEFVSSKTVTSGNRTIETITYKTERDGIIETHVEHRVTIHSDAPIDHDAELSAAIAEATQMNPDMTVEKIEVRQETST